jgi:cytochrome c oxidase cbb3-type subunit 4
MTLFHSFWTLTLLILFVSIVIWAWSSKRKDEFDEAASSPLNDDKLESETERG